MAVFEGKSPAERNKLIAAIVLGGLAIISLIYTFGGIFFGGKTTPVAVSDASPTPTVASNAQQNTQTQITAPNQDLINSDYLVTPIFYRGGIDAGPIGGRNIFAFYEPAAPTPRPSLPPPTPAPPPPPFTPAPPPTPHPISVSHITPQSVYAGSKAFRLEVNGSKFTENAKIVLNGTPLKTTFVSDQRLVANVSEAFIRSAGSGQLMVDTFDGKNFSNQVSFNIQEPPKPQVEYIGMQGKKHFNNDIAYFEKKGDKDPFGRRLNDVVAGRFRLISISEKEVEFEDVRLGFKHRLPMKRPDPSTFKSDPRTRRTPFRRRRGRRRSIPGIPDNIPRATPRPRQRTNNSNVKIPVKRP